MKKLIIYLLFALGANLYGQDFYMYVNGEKCTYDVSATKMLIKSETLDTAGIKNAMQKTIAGNPKNIYKLNDQLTMVDMQTESKVNLMELQKQWNTQEDILYISPVLLDKAGKEIGGYTNQVLIRLKSVDDYSLLTKSIRAYNIKDVKLCDFDEQTYILTLTKDAEKNAMQAANSLYETGLFEYAEPNLIQFIQLADDFDKQWGLYNTGQNNGVRGMDINVINAWVYTRGSSDIKVAVLDVGVELNHPNLVNNLLPGYDATGNNSNGAPGGNTEENAHGTACAGIIAAHTYGTQRLGIVGVADNCRILPVRIATNNGTLMAESQYIANGINWAWQSQYGNADVISMSFNCTETDALNTAISNAVNSGRNGKGCVLITSAGNVNEPVNLRFPGKNSNVITVGAIDNQGLRWSFSSYGSDLDVMAPGVDIYTTDLQGSAGYDTIDDYTTQEGTSLACPHVSGVAALILSSNPNLTEWQVRDIIKTTTRKVPDPLLYSNDPDHPNGTWDTYYGYGLVDAYASVLSAKCVNSFENQSVTANKIVHGCNNLNVQNVTVSNNAKLKLDAPGEVTINGNFEVQLGCELEIK
jgi:subtilisin family serine protease